MCRDKLIISSWPRVVLDHPEHSLTPLDVPLFVVMREFPGSATKTKMSWCRAALTYTLVLARLDQPTVMIVATLWLGTRFLSIHKSSDVVYSDKSTSLG